MKKTKMFLVVLTMLMFVGCQSETGAKPVNMKDPIVEISARLLGTWVEQDGSEITFYANGTYDGFIEGRWVSDEWKVWEVNETADGKEFMIDILHLGFVNNGHIFRNILILNLIAATGGTYDTMIFTKT